MSRYLGMIAILFSLTGCGTPGEDLLLYWSAMEKL